MSRFRALLMLVAFVALAATLAACGGSSDSSDEDPQKVIDTATLEGVESGSLDLSLAVKATGEDGGDFDLSLSGPFQSEGAGELPQLDLGVKADGSFGADTVDFEGGLTLLRNSAYVEYEGTEYEVDATTFGFVKSAIEEAQQEGEGGQGGASATACQEAAAKDIKIGDFVDNLTNEGSADVDGTSTTKISGDLQAPSAIEALVKLTEDPACKSQFEAAGPLPLGELEAAKTTIGEALKEAHVEVYVGDDDIIRKVVANLAIEPPEEGDEATDKVEMDFELSLGEVNEAQTISAPSGAKPLSVLFQKLDVNPIELLELGSSGGGLEGLLEGLGDTSMGGGGGGGSSSGGGGSSSGGPSVESSQEYLNCLKGASTPADLQKCSSLLQ